MSPETDQDAAAKPCAHVAQARVAAVSGMYFPADRDWRLCHSLRMRFGEHTRRALPQLAALLLCAFATLLANAQEPSYPTPVGYVNDFANALDRSGRDRLEGFLAAADEKLGVQMTVVTTNDIGDEDPREYANKLYEKWGVGNKKTNRGLMLLDVIRGPGKSYVWIEVGYGLEGVLPDGKVGAIRDQELIPYLKEGRREEGYAAATRALLKPVVQEMGQDPARVDELYSGSGYTAQRASSRGSSARRMPFPPAALFILILLIALRSRRRRRSGGIGYWGGFGGFGGFGGGGFGGGGGGGGFGGFGGGASGGGGAGGGY